jgi:colanic acid biosynthesis glycosyl transferase WcaI
MRIVIVTQWYPPEPAVLMHELAETLQTLGHTVHVLTGFPNYPSGRLYPGYRLRPWTRDTAGTVPLVRVMLYLDHSRSQVRRALNYISFALSAALLAPVLVPRPDVVFAYHPPLTVGAAAVWLSRIWRAPLVYQIQDMWPDTLAATGMVRSRQILRAIGALASWVYARASAICVISKGFRENLIRKGVPPERVRVISNWVDTSNYRPVAPDAELGKRLGLHGRFNVMFAGNIGEAQALETVLDAAELLRDLPDVQFVIVGDGVARQRLEDAVKEREIHTVRFLGPYPGDGMPSLYAHADALLVHLKDDPLFRITIPHKIFAYMASGKPVIAALAGDGADIITEAQAGVVCTPQDPAALARAVRTLRALTPEQRRRLADSGRKAIHDSFTREMIIGQIESVLQQVVR